VSNSDGNTPQSQIVRLIKEAATPARPKSTAKPRKPHENQPLTQSLAGVSVSGTGNVVALGSVTQHVVHHHAPAPRPKVVVQTGEGVIDAAQKAQIQRLREEWVTAYNAVKAKPLSHQASWAGLNRAMKVNSYAELKPEQFEAACAWLRRQTAVVRSAKSAPKKQGDTWRLARYRGIKARCKNAGNEFAYSQFIGRFNKTSLTELTADELEATYRYVLGAFPAKTVQVPLKTAQT
jgi:hypothetical protein